MLTDYSFKGGQAANCGDRPGRMLKRRKVVAQQELARVGLLTDYSFKLTAYSFFDICLKSSPMVESNAVTRACALLSMRRLS